MGRPLPIGLPYLSHVLFRTVCTVVVHIFVPNLPCKVSPIIDTPRSDDGGVG